MHRLLKFYGILTSLGMLLVLIQGALVTQTGSGDACGAEWPLCYGQLIPENPTIETLIEYTHRLVSGVLGIMVVVHAIWSWISIGHLRETKFFAFIAVLFIVLQGLLGAAAVVWGQSDAIMALHFGFSLISFASVVLLTILAFEDGKAVSLTRPVLNRNFKNLIFFNLIYMYAVVYTGAFVKHSGAGGACAGWPLCNGAVIPSLEGRTAIQFGHRVAAGLLFISILIMFIQMLKTQVSNKPLLYSGSLSMIFITAQVISGAVVIFTGFTLYATMAHAIIVSLLFATISYMSLLASRAEK
ncbi:COX15/CtaA family protein [Alkalicoccus daliensis]|uniref:Heme A synthase n=1 Tax=Alkalicoccus daliensis TaxID=745820 RepID=A0A1G9ZS14_9BACI|nr:heme A synthase [Alkalicoccus daliensis]SDN24088.1 cytochrome c oxidase assembly protein subunit 15 [Alkalicoccus daliensis]